MADPAFATARAVDALTDEALPGLPMTSVDKIEADLLAEVDPLGDALTEEVERTMTQHWDLAACPCLLCRVGRAIGCRPREMYLPHRSRP